MQMWKTYGSREGSAGYNLWVLHLTLSSSGGQMLGLSEKTKESPFKPVWISIEVIDNPGIYVWIGYYH